MSGSITDSDSPPKISARFAAAQPARRSAAQNLEAGLSRLRPAQHARGLARRILRPLAKRSFHIARAPTPASARDREYHAAACAQTPFPLQYPRRFLLQDFFAAPATEA